jgi:hypothetical protein
VAAGRVNGSTSECLGFPITAMTRDDGDVGDLPTGQLPFANCQLLAYIS